MNSPSSRSRQIFFAVIVICLHAIRWLFGGYQVRTLGSPNAQGITFGSYTSGFGGNSPNTYNRAISNSSQQIKFTLSYNLAPITVYLMVELGGKIYSISFVMFL